MFPPKQLVSSPMSHMGGLGGTIVGLAHGCCVCIMPKFNFRMFLNAVVQHEVSTTDDFLKKTGCTTAAIADIMHKVPMLLETSKYVCIHCLLIDSSRAVESIDHVILMNKLKSLNMLDNNMQWIVSSLTD